MSKEKRAGNCSPGGGTTNASWDSDFDSCPNYQVVFTGAPANATITQSGPWPFCNQNGTPLRSPIPVNGVNAVQIYICPNASGSYNFIPGPSMTQTTKTVTVG